MSKIKLLPCPFCGGEAEFYRMTTKQNFRWSDCVGVRCKTCGASCSEVLYDARIHPNDEEYYEAAKAWNTRKPIERIVKYLEEYGTENIHEENSGFIDVCIDIVKKEGGLC